MSKYIQDMLDRQAYIDQNMQKKSPFDAGVMRAVKSAKQSLALDEDQSDRATREGLYGFSEALQQDQAPIAKGGILGRLATAARGVPAGMRAYDQAEDAGVKQNSMMADMANRFRAAEEAKIAKMEQDAYMREMNDRKMTLEQEKLGEMRDYHNKSLLARKAAANPIVEYEGKPYRTLDKVDQRKANNIKKALNTSQYELGKIDEQLLNLKNITKDNTFSPMGTGSSITNRVKDSIGDIFGLEDYQNETAKRALLYATIGKFTTNAERALKGQGVLGQGFYDRLLPFFPNKDDNLPTLEEKLRDLKEHIKLESEVANISADQGIAYDIGDLMDQKQIPKQAVPDENGYVRIINLKTGKTGKVHIEDLEKAKAREWDLQ